MRLPTISQQRIQVQNLSMQYSAVASLQLMSSTGKKLIQSSDDPLLADKIKSIKSNINELKTYELNVSLAQDRSHQKGEIASETLNSLGRIKELIQKSQNETLNNNDRLSISKELEGILVEMHGLSNSTDINGEYIYSGFKIHTPPFIVQNGIYSYQGSDEASRINIGLTTQVNFTESGQAVFGDIQNGNGVFSTQADINNNQGTGIISSGTVINGALYDKGQYTITMVNNKDGKLAYKIEDNLGGQIIPKPPLTPPDDAPVFNPAENISFNGVATQITGQPSVGDKFYIKPSEKHDIFTSIQELINVLKTPINSDKTKADMNQCLGDMSAYMAQAELHFRAYESEIGNQGKVIENQKTLNESLINTEQIMLSYLQDADLPTLLTELTQQLNLLQVAQNAYLKIQETYNSFLMKR